MTHLQVQLSSGLDEDLHTGGGALLCGEVERRHARLVARIHQHGNGLDQDVEAVGVAIEGGNVEWSVVLRVVARSLQQRSDQTKRQAHCNSKGHQETLMVGPTYSSASLL